MKICLIGKYPPIQGGVSAHTYWLARGLARRGHEVHVVTNADEVEGEYRMSLGDDDAAWYQPTFPDSGGSVTVYNPEPFSRWAMNHIPRANPFVSKLASLATDVVRRERCDVIVAYYYEPYGMAGSMASHWTRRPLLVKHAGSDLDRLFGVADLATSYKEMLRGAAAVITQPRLMLRFLGMGIPLDRLQADVGYSIPDVFVRDGERLEVDRLAGLSATPPQTTTPFDAARPTIGTYGKIGRTKGTFDLIAALGRLAAEGRQFQFLALVGDTQGDQLRPHLRDAGLADRTWLLPLLPNWKVPAFIRTCSTVCFLERDFPVAIHGPMVPREILACGASLVLSGEIADKQRYRDRLASGSNVVIVKDPKDHGELAAALRPLVMDMDRARAIGAAGWHLSQEVEEPETFIDGWEDILSRHVNGRSADAAPASTSHTMTALEAVVPALLSFLCRRQSGLVREFVEARRACGPFESALALCDVVASRADGVVSGDEVPRLLEAIRYLKARLTAAHDPQGDATALFPVSDRLHDRPVSMENAGELRPVRGNFVRMEQFDYDVSGVFRPVPPGTQAADDAATLSSIPREAMLVLFQRSPNLVMRELRIDAATRELVNLCDGRLTTAELVAALCAELGPDAPGERAELESRVLDALQRLYRSRVIVFGEQQAGWGWSGGPR